MDLLEVVLFLLLCSVALGWVARRLNFPYPIALVIGGAALGFLPEMPQFPFDPQFILVLVLPPILYQAALLTSWRDFRANIRPIGFLAVGLVIATTLAVGAALKFVVPDIPWAAAFVLGAIVSPPDAVAATAILTRLNVPRRVVTILEGESLVNDASGLVLYKFAVAAVMTGAFSLRDASVEFVVVAVGGIVIGIILGWFFVFIHRHLGDVFIEVLMTLAVPYICYILAEALHLSGVLAVVAAGLVRGRYAPEVVSAEMRIIARSVWNLLVFLLNSLVFILIGLQLSGIIGRLTGYSAGDLMFYGVLVSVVAIAVRFAWIYPASWLALPLALDDGTPFPGRDLIIFLTFVVIAATLVLQGLSLGPLIRTLHVGTDWSEHQEEQHARFALGKAAIAAISEVAQKEGIAPELAERIRAEFAEKVRIAPPGGQVITGGADVARRLRVAAIRAERQELIRIWRANRISDDVLHHLEEDLDYQESRL